MKTKNRKKKKKKEKKRTAQGTFKTFFVVRFLEKVTTSGVKSHFL
jgi:hypothetical protein